MYFLHSERLADQLVKAPITKATKAKLFAEAKRFDRIASKTLVPANAFVDAVIIGACSLIAWGALWLGVKFLFWL